MNFISLNIRFFSI